MNVIPVKKENTTSLHVSLVPGIFADIISHFYPNYYNFIFKFLINIYIVL